MSLQAVLLIFTLSTFNLAFTNCFSSVLQKSELPKEMPEKTIMSWKENGGMLPAWKSIEISENQVLFEEKNSQEDEPRFWAVEIPLEEKEKLYQVFVRNKFDMIENDKREEIVYDAGSESIYIRAGKISKNVSYGANSPLSGLNRSRYSAIAKAIKAIEKKYKSKAKEINQNITVINYSPKKHGYIFKEAKRTTLTYIEIDKIYSMLEQAVDENNPKQSESRKVRNLSEYKIQFLPVISQNGEKGVYVNGVCSVDDINWRKELVKVLDGGNCYFQMYVNLTKNTYGGFNVNGEA